MEFQPGDRVRVRSAWPVDGTFNGAIVGRYPYPALAYVVMPDVRYRTPRVIQMYPKGVPALATHITMDTEFNRSLSEYLDRELHADTA